MRRLKKYNVRKNKNRHRYAYRRNPDFSDVPANLMEIKRVVPPESTEGIEFQTFMEGLLKKLFPKARLNPFRFIITDESELNAFFLVGHAPPVLGFSRGLLLRSKYIEDILGILGHEFTHKKFVDIYGEHHNSKLEELAADAWPLLLLADAGLDPREYVEFTKNNILIDKHESYLNIVVDVHPTAVNRIRVLEDGLAVLDKKRGGFAHLTPTPLTTEFFKSVENSKHYSFIDLYVKSVGLDTLSNEQKLIELKKLITSDMSWNIRRSGDLNKLLQKLKIKRSNEGERLAQNQLADAILDLAKGATSHLSMLTSNFGGVDRENLTFGFYRSLVGNISSEGARPIGRLKLYEDAIYTLMEADKKSTALDAAEDLLELIANEPLNLRLVARIVPWPHFKEPTFPTKGLKSKKPASWNKHVIWAESDTTETIARALVALGIVDRRLFERFIKLELSFKNRKLNSLFTPLVIETIYGGDERSHDSITIDKCEIDEDGYIHLPSTGIQSIIQKERVAAEDFDILESQLDKLEAWFLRIKPGDTVEESHILEEKERLLGSFTQGVKGKQTRWLGLKRLEHNFPLFLELNDNILGEAGTDAKAALLFARELTELASGVGIPELKNDPEAKSIKDNIRGLFLGFPVDSRLYRYSFEQRFISLGLPIFVDSSPLERMILINPGNLFTRKEQLMLLNRGSSSGDIDFRFRGHKSIVLQPLILVRQLLGYQEPKTGADLNKLIDKLKDGDALSKSLLLIEFGLLIRTKEGLKYPKGLDLDKVIEAARILGIDSNEDLQFWLRPLIEKKVWPRGLEQLIDQWVAVNRAGLFPVDQVLCYSLLQKIVDRIGNIKSYSKQIELFERIFFVHKIKDPKVRNAMENLWVRAVYQELGLDTNTRAYSGVIQPILKRLSKLDFNTRATLADKLANQLQTQPNLTHKFKDLVQSLTKAGLESSFLRGAILEAAILKLRQTKRGREQLMEFLLNELSKKSIHQMNLVLVEEVREELTYSAAVTDIAEHRAQRQIPAAQIHAELKFMWENFWAAPFGVRAVLFEQVLFPHISEDPAENKEIMDSVFAYVNDKLFPLSEPYSQEARYFIEAYFRVIPAYQYRILLSAMMVTVEKNSGGMLPIGQRLAMVLELLGPAETKLGQIIHSHPQTPAEIKQGMGRLKSKADPPFRWDLIDLVEERVSRQFKKKIGHIGALLGSASFYLAVELDLTTGSKGVLKMLRAFALERARSGFQIMLKMVDLLRQNFSDSMIVTLRQMIAQAEQSAIAETDGDISIHQAAYALQIYDGRQVVIENDPVTLHVCKIIETGQDYQYIEKAPGKHFNDLPEENAGQQAHKEHIALAYYAFELTSILRGRRFDNDRHGAQLRIEGNDIYLFDWGGMLLNDPTEQELNQLGETIFDICLAIQSGGQLNDVLLNTVQARSNQGEDVSYLLNVQRAMLALEDFRGYIKQEMLFALLKSVLQSNVIHPAIMNGLVGKAMAMGIDMDQVRGLLAEGKAISLRILRRR